MPDIVHAVSPLQRLTCAVVSELPLAVVRILRNTGIHRVAKNAEVLIVHAGGAYSYHSLVGCWLFFSCLHEDCRRRRKSVFSFFPRRSCNYCTLQQTRNKCQSMCVQKRYAGLSANCPMLAPDFKQNWKLSTVFSRSFQYQIT